MVVHLVLGQVPAMYPVAAGIRHSGRSDLGNVENISVPGDLPLQVQPVEEIVLQGQSAGQAGALCLVLILVSDIIRISQIRIQARRRLCSIRN